MLGRFTLLSTVCLGDLVRDALPMPSGKTPRSYVRLINCI